MKFKKIAGLSLLGAAGLAGLLAYRKHKLENKSEAISEPMQPVTTVEAEDCQVEETKKEEGVQL